MDGERIEEKTPEKLLTDSVRELARTSGDLTLAKAALILCDAMDATVESIGKMDGALKEVLQ